MKKLATVIAALAAVVLTGCATTQENSDQYDPWGNPWVDPSTVSGPPTAK